MKSAVFLLTLVACTHIPEVKKEVEKPAEIQREMNTPAIPEPMPLVKISPAEKARRSALHDLVQVTGNALVQSMEMEMSCWIGLGMSLDSEGLTNKAAVCCHIYNAEHDEKYEFIMLFDYEDGKWSMGPSYR